MNRTSVLFLILVAIFLVGPYVFLMLALPHGYHLFVRHLEPPKEYVNLSDLRTFPEIAEALESGKASLNFTEFLKLYKFFNGSETVVRVNGSYYKVYLRFHGVIRKIEKAENYSHVSYNELPKILRRVKFELLNSVGTYLFIAENVSEIVELKEFLDKHGRTIELNDNYYVILAKYAVFAKGIEMPTGACIVLTHDDLKNVPILETAIELAKEKGEYHTRISKDVYHKILELIGNGRCCVEYDGECYRIGIVEVKG